MRNSKEVAQKGAVALRGKEAWRLEQNRNDSKGIERREVRRIWQKGGTKAPREGDPERGAKTPKRNPTQHEIVGVIGKQVDPGDQKISTAALKENLKAKREKKVQRIDHQVHKAQKSPGMRER
eukprot:GFKZ01014506.1.p1 GENE.GFKZ01014506.1~~GFKZ01014506.1.p1  ORF type:complete len:123 (-),score=19.09 GFKZ01014506.1:257-625(-)